MPNPAPTARLGSKQPSRADQIPFQNLTMKRYTPIEQALVALVIFAVVGPILFAVLQIKGGGLKTTTLSMVDTAFGILSLCWVACLVAWLYFKQHVTSRLWTWMPPFVFFGRLPMTIRVAVIVALCMIQMAIFVVKIATEG
jgi:hypothetical protein